MVTGFHDEIIKLGIYFENNCFPRKLFLRYLNKILYRKMVPPISISTVPKLKMYASFPFLHDDNFRKKLIDIIHKELPALNLKLIPKNPVTIGSLFIYKDKLSPMFTSNVVYKYICPRCSRGTYVGCTKRLLKVRLDSHRGVSFGTGSRLSNPEQSNIRNHSKICKTHIEAKDFQIIGHIQNENEFHVLESIMIKKLVPSLNSQNSSIQLCIT